MDPAPLQPEQSPQPVANQAPNHKQSLLHSPTFYLALFVTTIVGIVLGYLLNIAVNNQTQSQSQPTQNQSRTTISLPSDAERIQTCSTGRGALYIRPSDIPLGPIYMVHEGAVIGVEYMISQTDLLSNQPISELVGFALPIDHVNIGPVLQGHAGFSEPHYHVDLLMITPEEQASIVCADGEDTGHMMPGMTEGDDVMMEHGDQMETPPSTSSGIQNPL